MKSQLIAVGSVVVFVVSLFSLSVNTNFVNAVVICVDKYQYSSIIPCSDVNAIDKNSLNLSQRMPEGAKNTTTNFNTPGQITCVVPAPTGSKILYVPALCDDPAAPVLLPNGSISGDFGNQTSANTIRNITSSTLMSAPGVGQGNRQGNMTSGGPITFANCPTGNIRDPEWTYLRCSSR